MEVMQLVLYFMEQRLTKIVEYYFGNTMISVDKCFLNLKELIMNLLIQHSHDLHKGFFHYIVLSVYRSNLAKCF